MKAFFEDYGNMIMKPQTKWLKKHWKGYLLICVIYGLLSFMAFEYSKKGRIKYFEEIEENQVEE